MNILQRFVATAAMAIGLTVQDGAADRSGRGGRGGRRFKNMAVGRGGWGTVQAAGTEGATTWSGVNSSKDEDAANKASLDSLGMVLQRSQDLDINNPDLRGFHRARVAQILGAHVKFKCTPDAGEIGMTPDAAAALAAKIDRLRHLHSEAGGFDAAGKGRFEGMQQVRAMLTAFIHGGCLIHRVWRIENEVCPLSIELIPGVRISTPIDRAGDPKLSYGIEYSDTHRSRVVAYHVRRVSKTVGDTFVPDFTWDRLPAEDCSFLEPPEPAGMDRAMPLAVANVRMLRNRGEMIEAMVEAARAQSDFFCSVEVEKGTSPSQAALDQSDLTEALPFQFMSLGGVKAWFQPNGRKVNWNSAKLPDPNFKEFMEVTDGRLARGVSSSKSRFTREVTSSWAGGRMEEQQDQPIIDQYRQCLLSAWRKVHCWFLEALWLSGRIEMPGYGAQTAIFWNQFRAEFPAQVDINPQDTWSAMEKGMMLRQRDPLKEAEKNGTDFQTLARNWARAMKILQAAETEAGLEEGSLSILFAGKSVTTSAGDDVGAPQPIDTPDPDAPVNPPAKKNGNGKTNGHHRLKEVLG